MKKIALVLFTAFIITTAFVAHKVSGIHGTISPADAAKKVWAVSGRDTVSITPSSGTFSLEVKPGNWKLLIEAVKPYKDAVVTNIIVEEGRYTDAGEIKLVSD